jgi:hypothetical protein
MQLRPFFSRRSSSDCPGRSLVLPAILALNVSLCANGQANSIKKPVQTNAVATTAAQNLPTPKVTPKQLQGLRLLEVAQAEAAGLPPDMRAFVLWQVSNAYQNSNPAKADTLLKDAFRATESIDPSAFIADGCWEQVCRIQKWLQESILLDMLSNSHGVGQFGQVERLAIRADPNARAAVISRLIYIYAEKKAFDRARQLLDQVADGEGYPYEAAVELMLRLSEQQAADRQAIFAQESATFGSTAAG